MKLSATIRFWFVFVLIVLFANQAALAIPVVVWGLLSVGEYQIEKKPTLQSMYKHEYKTILKAAKANNCTKPELLCILFAIRSAENGRAGLEFGVMHKRAKDQPNSLRVQAGWCAATISNNYKRWMICKDDIDFITFLGDRYCPVGAENDPTGLNENWIKNVRSITERNLRAYNKDPKQQFVWLRTATASASNLYHREILKKEE